MLILQPFSGLIPVYNCKMNPKIMTILLLLVSNVFMTFAWYGHLKLQNAGVTSNWPLIGVILLSWALAFFEYCFMIPANRVGYVENGGPFSLVQLKVVQEVISLVIFTIIVTLLFKGEQFRWNHIVAFGLLVASVYFAFLPGKTS